MGSADDVRAWLEFPEDKRLAGIREWRAYAKEMRARGLPYVGMSDVTIQDVGSEGSAELMTRLTANQQVTVTDYLVDPDVKVVMQFIVDWVTGDADAARDHVSDHRHGDGATLVARIDGRVAGLVTVRWTSRNLAFAEHGIPLIHQLAVAPEFRRRGVATALMDAVEQLVAARGRSSAGVTVGLVADYGPAQRLYAKRGYVPDGRGACKGRAPLRLGETVEVDHDLILWLVKDL